MNITNILTFTKNILVKLLKNWKKVILITIGGYIAYLTISIIFLENEEPIKVKTEIIVKNTNLTGFMGGKKIWDFKADTVEYKDASTSLAKKIRGCLYKADKPFMEISASKATVDSQSNNFTATGGVILRVIGKDQEFQSENLQWVAYESKISASGNLIVRVENNILTGENLVYYLEKESFQLDKQIRLELDIEVQ